jgi:hypothetical protein
MVRFLATRKILQRNGPEMRVATEEFPGTRRLPETLSWRTGPLPLPGVPMPRPLAEWLLRFVLVWLAAGVLFALAFAWRGAAAIEPAARGGTRGFRLLILPGAALLWPWLLRRWLAAGDSR